MGVTIDYSRGYNATVNHKAETDFLRALATDFAGAENVMEMERPSMGSEDFAYMLAERPGSYFFLGSARTESDPPLHHPRYDFNDDILPLGQVSGWSCGEMAGGEIGRSGDSADREGR